MNNFKLPKAQVLILIYLLISFPCLAQVNWNQIDIASKEAKVLKTPHWLRFTLSVNAATTVAKTQSDHVNPEDVLNALNDDSIHAILIEKFSGYFFYANTSNPINLEGSSSKIILGSQLSKSIGKNFEAGVGVKFIKQKWNGTFPVTVTPFGVTLQHIEYGTIASEASYFLLNTNGTYYFWSSKISPFLTAGAQLAVLGKPKFNAELEGVAMELNEPEKDNQTVSAFGGAGVRFIFGKHLFAQAVLGVNKFPSQQYAPLIQVGIGAGI